MIEPYRAASVPKGIAIIEKEMQTLGFEVYDALEKDDVLFIDSSHVVMPYGDTLTEFVSILPRLNTGVLVHIHDIFLPFDYMPNWAEKNKVYTEQWVLALMLYGAASEWEVVWGSRIMMMEQKDFLLTMKHYPGDKPNGGAMWIRKLGPARRG